MFGTEIELQDMFREQIDLCYSRDLSCNRKFCTDSEICVDAFIAMNEAMPPLLSQCFQTLLQLSSDCSLERNVTGLPTEFFAQSGFYLARTYAFNEDPERPSFALSFGRHRQNLSSPLTTLRVMLNQLTHPLCLRVGCRSIDSSFMAYLPVQIQTLDVAFKDPDPQHLAANLQTMRGRCERLFTLAIAVSPLHDRDTLDGSEDRLFNRKSMSKDILQLWEPFWNSLEHLKNTGVRVWEGEGPGSRRPKVVDTTV